MDRVKITRLNFAVSHTTESAQSTGDKCQLCKQCITAPSLSNLHQGNLKVSYTIGKCGHCFHKNCIESHLSKGTSSCPVDNTPWLTQTEHTLVNTMDARDTSA